MNSKTSFFSLSKGMIKEDIKRCWPITLVIFVLMFFCSTFVILMFSDNVETQASILTSFISCGNPVMLILSVVFPILTAVFLFKYMLNTDSVSIMHSIPTSRAQLFFSKYLTGLMMLTAPLLLICITIAPLLEVVYEKYKAISIGNSVSYMSFMGFIEVGDFSISLLVKCFFMYLLTMFFVYSLSVLAVVVSGNTVMSVVNSLLFNFMGSVCYMVITYYFSLCLYGYDFTQNQYISARTFSPLFTTLSFGGETKPFYIIVYICVIILSCLFAAWLYRKRGLEKTGMPLAFRAMEVFALYLITFIIMFVVGYIFYIMGESMTGLYGGILAGGIIALIGTTMIIQKSFNIFNKRALLMMGSYVIIAAIFISTVNFDLLGFETRVPDAKSVKQAQAKGYEFASPIRAYDIFFDAAIGIKAPIIKDTESIKYLAAFNMDIGKSKEGKIQDKNLTYYDNEIHYSKKGPFNQSRKYAISYDFIKSNDNLKKLLESDGFKKNAPVMSLGSLNITSIEGVQFTSDATFDGILDSYIENGDIQLNNGDEVSLSRHIESKYYDELIKIIQADYQDATFEEMISTKRPATYLNINYKDKDNMESFFTMTVPSTYKRTVKWLEEKGYSDNIILQYDPLYKVEAYIINKNNVSANKVTITDESLREKIFYNTDDNLTHKREYIIVKFTYPISMIKDKDEYDYLKDQGRKAFKMYYNINQENPLYDQIVEQYEKHGQS